MPPKRKASEDAAGPTKKSKLDAPSADHTRTEKSATPGPQVKDEDHFWEILDGDSRSRLEVGVEAPNRLTLKFRHRIDARKKPAEHTYSKPADQVDWNDKTQIRDINRWRRQIFSRTMKFPSRANKSPFAPFEEAFMEVMLEALQRVPGNATLPHQTKIFEAFNEFFQDRDDLTDAKGNKLAPREERESTSLKSYIRRPGTPRAVIREEIKKRMKDKSDGANVPVITDAMIKAYMERKVDPAKTGGQKKTPSAPGTVVTQKLHEPTEKAVRQAPANTLAGKPKSSTTIKKPTQAPPLSKPVTDTAMPDAPNQLQTPTPPAPTPTAGTEQLPHDPRDMSDAEAERLRKEGWSVPDLPKTDDEALERHRNERKSVLPLDDWMVAAYKGVDERLERLPIIISGPKKRDEGRLAWHPGLRDTELVEKEKTQRKEAYDNTPVHERHEGAAAVNGLQNFATTPPFGFQGDLHNLSKDPRMPEDERLAAEASEAARRKFEKAHDLAFEAHSKGLKEAEASRIADQK